jgi:DNA repair photolyase
MVTVAENTPDRAIDEALRKQHEAWREEQELMREGYEERAEEDLAMVREFDGVDHQAKLHARVVQLKKMRQIGIDIEACIAECTCVPEFMKLAFTDAITASGDRPKPYLKSGEGGEKDGG